MRRALLWGLAGLPTAAAADIDWRIAARAGAQFSPTGSFERVASPQAGGAQEVLLDRRITGPWWIGLAGHFSSAEGDLFKDFTTRWSLTSIRPTAMGRWPLGRHLAVTGRVGPTLDHATFELRGRRTLETTAWTAGIYAGAGIDLIAFANRAKDSTLITGFGLTLEASYHQVLAVEVDLADAAPASLNPSGPGIALGLGLEF